MIKKYLCVLSALSMLIQTPIMANNIQSSKDTDTALTANNCNSENTIVYENYENNVLKEISSKLKNAIEMCYTEQAFLNGIVRKHKPKKILELGVSSGGSSAILLNACKDIEGAQVFSVDKLTHCYKNRNKPAGYIVNEKFPEFTKNWKLYTGGIISEFIEDIGNDIDFCFIDTAHTRPGEILDFLSVLPYLKKGAIVCFHDIGPSFNWGLESSKPAYYSNDILFSTIKGEKIVPKKQYHEFFPNMGAVILDQDQEKSFFDYFFLLTLPWQNLLPKNESDNLTKYFSKHYDISLVEMFRKAINANNKYHNKVIIRS